VPDHRARRRVLLCHGGFERLRLSGGRPLSSGIYAAEAGHSVILSSYVIENHIGGGDLGRNAAHRLRWARSTRRSRPLGYSRAGCRLPPCAASAVALRREAPPWWPALLLNRRGAGHSRLRGFGARAQGQDQLAAASARGTSSASVFGLPILRQYDRLAWAAVPSPPPTAAPNR